MNTHAQIDAYSVFFGAQIRVYFTKLQQIVTVEVPGAVEVLDCENLVILELPSHLNEPGFIMVIFGAQNAAIFHLSASTIKPDGYTLHEIFPLLSQGLPSDMKISTARLVTQEPNDV